MKYLEKNVPLADGSRSPEQIMQDLKRLDNPTEKDKKAIRSLKHFILWKKGMEYFGNIQDELKQGWINKIKIFNPKNIQKHPLVDINSNMLIPISIEEKSRCGRYDRSVVLPFISPMQEFEGGPAMLYA